MSDERWWLAIDFGTSNTAAAHTRTGDGSIHPVSLTHRSNLLPSAVFVRADGDTLTGDAAQNAAAHHPEGFVPAPKRLISQPFIRTGHVDLTPPRMIAAVLRTVIRRAAVLHNDVPPERVVLTHPEAWSRATVAVLVDAASRAGIDPSTIATVSEPRAAAYYYTRTAHLPPGTALAVFDFGGGTADVAVLRIAASGVFDVVAARGDNALGGKNFDALIRRWALDHVADRDSTSRAEFADGAPGSIEAIRALDEAARGAKEVLSETPSATIAVIGSRSRTTLSLTRPEFDSLITPQVESAVDLVRDTLADAGITPGSLHALYLTGGSSRIPLVHQELSRMARVATLDDPKTVVAQGALIAARHMFASDRDAATDQNQGAAPSRVAARQSTNPGAGPNVPEPSSSASTRNTRRGLIAGAVAALVAVGVVIAWVGTRGNSVDPQTLAGPSTGVSTVTVAQEPTTARAPTTTPVTTSTAPTTAYVTTARTTSARSPRGVVTVANADAQGFVDEVGPRCNADNEALGIARTTDSLIVVCRTGVDRLYYKGVRVEDGSGIEIDDPIVVADGFQVTNAGVTYRFDDSALLITEGGTELAREPMLEFWSVYN
ncbi:Hsp70 family protein [Rhodococcus artemisiae]|uniref:Hsp70 family protein n=1 Tax=Rhodococcus artemisiae TaxID=714159 RepID=A0ABU7LEL1_9NOCA|nr:Hsp70 family protein [Rhodococcus artemisiae]MEE2059986.1 Hsp70 family protein [Rhodococcus artemisiae]